MAATADVDLKYQIEYVVKKKFEELFSEIKKHLDPVGHEAWMPQETEYIKIFSGQIVSGYIAEPVFVILSKAKMARNKNRQLIVDYLASKDLDPRLFDLAEKYNVDVESL